MEHQDWKVVYLKKNGKDLKPFQKKRGETTSVRKPVSHQTKKALDDNPETFKTETVSHSLRTQIQKARQVQGMTQKEIAQKINVTPAIIQSYENGKAVPNPQVLQKLRRVLKTQLKK